MLSSSFFYYERGLTARAGRKTWQHTSYHKFARGANTSGPLPALPCEARADGDRCFLPMVSYRHLTRKGRSLCTFSPGRPFPVGCRHRIRSNVGAKRSVSLHKDPPSRTLVPAVLPFAGREIRPAVLQVSAGLYAKRPAQQSTSRGNCAAEQVSAFQANPIREKGCGCLDESVSYQTGGTMHTPLSLKLFCREGFPC